MCEVWFMDTGAGWSGKLSMMNIDTKEIFMSDPVPELYPGVKGRQRK
jgi:serine/threonine protein phosphatase 1